MAARPMEWTFEQCAAIEEVLRVQPTDDALKNLEQTLDAWDAMAGNRKERAEASALRVLIENSRKAKAIFAELPKARST